MWKDWKKRNFGEEYTEKITIKKLFMVHSRKDLRDGMKPTPLRLLLFIGFLFVCILLLDLYMTRLRDEKQVSPTPKGANDIQFSFVGDVSLARYVQEYGETKGYESLFQRIKPVWENSDLVFANLECVVLDREEQYEKPDSIPLAATRDGLMSVVNSGINALALGNNHSHDYGVSGLAYELKMMEQIGLTYSGAGVNREAASTGCVITNGEFKIGFVSCTFSENNTSSADDYTVGTVLYPDFYKNIRELSESTDLVVVYAHWGNENAIVPNEKQIQNGHRLIEAGADIVIGAHPHVLQSVEVYKDGVILYSLGNFIFDQGSRVNRNSVVAQLNLDRESRVGELILIPVRNDELIPRITDNPFYLNRIRKSLTGKLKTNEYSISKDGRIHIPVSFR